MAYLNLEDFEKEISSSVLESDLAKIPITIVQTLTFVKLRVPLEGGEFIDCYFNEITKRTSFALISRGKRVFGANNTGGWHIHPFKDPSSHKPIPETISFKDFLKKFEILIISQYFNNVVFPCLNYPSPLLGGEGQSLSCLP